MYVTKFTARAANVGEQLFTLYGRGRIVPKHAIRQSCPPSLLHKTVPYVGKPVEESIKIPTMSDTLEIEEMTRTAPIVPKHYGYSTDSLWEITMCIEGAREKRRTNLSHIRNQARSVRNTRENFQASYKVDQHIVQYYHRWWFVPNKDVDYYDKTELKTKSPAMDDTSFNYWCNGT